MFAFALWDAARGAAARRPRPGRQEAALLFPCAASGLSFASELRALLEDETVPREVDAAGDRLLPGLRLRAGAAERLSRGAQAAAGDADGLRGGRRRARALLAARLLAQASRRGGQRAACAAAGATAGGDPPAAGRRRAAGGVPLRRYRLLRGRCRDGRGDERAGTHLLDRLRRRALRRARARARGRGAVRNRARGAAGAPGRDRRSPRASPATTASPSPIRRRFRASIWPR